MTLRAFIIGIFAVAAVGAMGYISMPLGLGMLIDHHLPAVAFGFLTVFLVTLGPLLSRMGERWRLKPSEMAVILTMVLAACSVPERGMLRELPHILAMPIRMHSLTPGWQKNDLLNYAPRKAMPAEGQNDPGVIDTYISGAGRPGNPIHFSDIPWKKWVAPLAAWFPLAILMSICSICLAIIVHRQWSQRERLRYPLADVTATLMAQEPGRHFPAIFRERWFLIGMCIVLLIHLVNGLAAWNPGWIKIPLSIDFSAAQQKWPDFFKLEYSNGFAIPRFFPIVIGFAFLLASDISLSLGLSQIFYVLLGFAAYRAGVDLSTEYMRGGIMGWNRFGAYVAFSVMMIYAGRRYYGSLLGAAFAFKERADVNPSEKWSARVLLISFCLSWVLLTRIGLDWPFSFLTIALIMMMFLVVARITAETGLFFVHPRWQVMGVLMGLFGAYALSPESIIIMGMAGAVLSLDASQSLLGYVTNSLRICERTGVKVSRAATYAFGAWAWAALLITPLAFWFIYNYGVAGFREKWITESIPKMVFGAANSAATELSLSGQLRESVTLEPLQRLLYMHPENGFIWAAGVGFAIVLIMAFLRLRLSWWPLHPVMFLVWATHPLFLFSHSFLLGWFIKTTAVRIGGMGAYHRAKPFMIGLIAGDLFSAFTWVMVSAVYRIFTGLEAPIYTILQ